MTSRARNLLLATTALVPLGATWAGANPLGAQVVGGSAAVQGQGTASVTVTQSTPKAIINWNTFNIAPNETTKFVQPDANAIALNKVVGNLGPSMIDGLLTANGKIFIVNGDGILFGPHAVVNVGSLLATTSDIKNADFMAGRYNFSIPGRPDASIVNLGNITAANGGFAALVAPGVRNSGTITATLGTVALAAGNVFNLDFYGDKLINLAVNDQIAATVKDVATGKPLDALVKNDGALRANGGRVELTAAGVRVGPGGEGLRQPVGQGQQDRRDRRQGDGDRREDRRLRRADRRLRPERRRHGADRRRLVGRQAADRPGEQPERQARGAGDPHRHHRDGRRGQQDRRVGDRPGQRRQGDRVVGRHHHLRRHHPGERRPAGRRRRLRRGVRPRAAQLQRHRQHAGAARQERDAAARSAGSGNRQCAT